MRITATPARHGPVGIEPIAGDVVGFVVTDEASNRDLVYVTGDTCWFSGVEEVARRFHPEQVLLFAGAAQTRGPFHLAMDTFEEGLRRRGRGTPVEDSSPGATRPFLGIDHPSGETD